MPGCIAARRTRCTPGSRRLFRGAYADPLPAAQLDLARRRAASFVDVRDAADVHLDTRPTARLRVPGRERRRALDDVRRESREMVRVAHDDVAPGDAARHVQPEILRRR